MLMPMPPPLLRLMPGTDTPDPTTGPTATMVDTVNTDTDTMDKLSPPFFS